MSKQVYLTKMDATGNILLLLNGLGSTLGENELVSIAKKSLDPQTGLGGDQLLVVMDAPRNQEVHFTMKIYNQDGSEAEMCGNGLRCFCKYLLDNHLVPPSLSNQRISIFTLGGIVHTEIISSENTSDILYVKVDMGEPNIINPSLSINITFNNAMKTLSGAYISMGNPHCVIFLNREEITDHWVNEIGPQVENNPLFKNKTNVEFVAMNNDGSLFMRVWERGCGETLSCGSGACAAAVAAIQGGYSEKPHLDIHTRGGTLGLYWNKENNHIFKTGPVKTVLSKLFFYS